MTIPGHVVPAALGPQQLAAPRRAPATEVTVATSHGGTVRLHATGAPGTAVTTDVHKWETSVRGVRAEEFDHFAAS
ncbi:hypothetical protein ACFVFT_24975 [Streptomyces tendae]|uniref:hypothetical protein n=1 Tax=Streptomyces tendae TaxID=1932 RepID=UPI00368DB338